MIGHKDFFVIEGLGGEKKLKGKVTIGGAKNAALPLIASVPLFSDPLRLENVPIIEDIDRMEELMTHLGYEVTRDKNKHTLSIHAGKKLSGEMDYEISKRMRASVILTGPILARHKKVSFPHPGGCVIGARPIDLFIEGFKKMGAKIAEEGKMYVVEAPKGLRGADIFFNLQSVTATETFLMAAVLAKGTTTLKNCALEPEVTALAEFLHSRGAHISGIGTTTLTIKGGELLKAGGKTHKVIPDRIEAGSFLFLGALCADNILLEHCDPAHLEVVIRLLQSSGVPIEIGSDWIRISKNGKKNYKAFNVKTHEYPGFPTDLQAPAVVFLTQTEGESSVFETIFEGRLNYSEDLVKMGANIAMHNPHKIEVKGKTPLRGKELEGPDIRAGLAFIIAALVAKGQSVINNVYYIDRGYERIEEQLQKIGANIKRIKGK